MIYGEAASERFTAPVFTPVIFNDNSSAYSEQSGERSLSMLCSLPIGSYKVSDSLGTVRIELDRLKIRRE